MDEDLAVLRRAAETTHDPQAWLRLTYALLRAGKSPEALRPARMAARLAPNDLEAAQLLRRVFAEATRPVPDVDLRRAIGDALGLAGPFPDAPGWKHFDLLAGALDPITRAVAWVEDRQDPRPDDPRPGWVECQVELRAARDGRELVTWPLHHYNPYFGTKVFHLHVEDEQAIVVYDEKHRTYVAVVPFNGRPRFQALGRFAAHLILPDRILFVHYERQWSLGGFTLPELEPCRTVPIAIDGQANALSTRAVLRIEDDTVVVPLANGREARAPVSLRPEIGPQRG